MRYPSNEKAERAQIKTWTQRTVTKFLLIPRCYKLPKMEWRTGMDHTKYEPLPNTRRQWRWLERAPIVQTWGWVGNWWTTIGWGFDEKEVSSQVAEGERA